MGVRCKRSLHHYILIRCRFGRVLLPRVSVGWTISLLATPFTILVPTALYEYYDAHQIAEAKTIIRYSTKYFLAVAVPAAFVFSVLPKPILLVLTTP